ncbi:expression site-associated gene 9 (ESAG9) protein, putative [Trypanosoma brucei brucei TREU927]|uniref:Expression site-associated gene 9 (ESAG9) protein, putative n=1 Tax=Trypanosoma brucei brucei (strain 927/4 GUTat10.1) TaxID=185431 RepID=Q38EL0_TRYB2|nr:expression site-associated protein [Trypanosoma brucei brucei TREU927]EAN76760.1 expression site-associated gene 9 (ESAG9) protein, putative [Trypanosoma brucei brucei TREU927]
MFMFIQTLFLTLILLALLIKSEASIGVSVTDQRCDYWDYSNGKEQCRTWNVGASRPNTVSPRPVPTPLLRNKNPPNMNTVTNQMQEAQGSGISSPTTDSGTNRPASNVENHSSEVNVKPGDRQDSSGRGSETSQPSESPRVSEPAVHQAAHHGEQKVSQEEQKLGVVKQEGAENNRREGGEGERVVSTQLVTAHNRGHVTRPSPQGVSSGSGQSDAVAVAADIVDVWESAESTTRSGNGAWHSGSMMILSVALSFICS